jgi:hypothetical protein
MADEPTAQPGSRSPEQDVSKAVATKSHEEQAGSDVEQAPATPTHDSTNEGKSSPKSPANETANGNDHSDVKSKAAEATETAEVIEATEAGDVTTASIQTAQAATPNTSSKNKKRKSTSGVPEHKSKKLSRKKSMPNLHLDVQPGQYWFARMKGHPSWPAIVCDEEMLPESLLIKRPVSAWRPDGSYRADFEDDGKNVRDRRYPVMFLSTNEFYWIVNSDLEELDMDEVKLLVENDERGKKTKALWDAYQIAAEDNDLDHFKTMLLEHERARIRDAQEKAEKESKKNAKKEKASKVKAEEDVDMDDADAGEHKPKKTVPKKRKKEPESEDEIDKATKTMKTKLKVNGPKVPAESTASKPKKLTKGKKPKPSEEVEAEADTTKEPEEPPRFADKKKQAMFKRMYSIRSVLQRGLLLKSGPKEDEIDRLHDTLSELEQIPDVDGDVIRESRIHRVLKNIIKLKDIPKEEEFNFKRRSSTVLGKWTKILSGDGNAAATEKENGASKSQAQAKKADDASATKSDAVPVSTVPDTKVDKQETANHSSPAGDASGASPGKPEAADKAADEDVTMEDVKENDDHVEGVSAEV